MILNVKNTISEGNVKEYISFTHLPDGLSCFRKVGGSEHTNTKTNIYFLLGHKIGCNNRG
jgi:hypothetical protein